MPSKSNALRSLGRQIVAAERTNGADVVRVGSLLNRASALMGTGNGQMRRWLVRIGRPFSHSLAKQFMFAAKQATKLAIDRDELAKFAPSALLVYLRAPEAARVRIRNAGAIRYSQAISHVKKRGKKPLPYAERVPVEGPLTELGRRLATLVESQGFSWLSLHSITYEEGETPRLSLSIVSEGGKCKRVSHVESIHDLFEKVMGEQS